MNCEQYQEWKENTYKSLVMSGIYTEYQASVIVNWFDSIKGSTERSWFGDELLDSLSKHWNNNTTGLLDCFVYKTLTARAWLYADTILKYETKF